MDYTEQDQLSLTGTTSLSGSFGNGTLTITGNDTIEEYIDVIGQITYINTADEPMNSVRVIVITVTDSPLTSGDSATSNSINIL